MTRAKVIEITRGRGYRRVEPGKPKCVQPPVFMTLREIRKKREEVRALVAWLDSVENVKDAV